jgi:hypothetical protein
LHALRGDEFFSRFVTIAGFDAYHAEDARFHLDAGRRKRKLSPDYADEHRLEEILDLYS